MNEMEIDLIDASKILPGDYDGMKETYVCVNKAGYPQRYKRKLTLGKKYGSNQVKLIDGVEHIYIYDDKGDFTNYRLSMFKTLSEAIIEIRNKRLETLLNK